MGMIIRVAFNNQNWAGKCKNADQRDRRLIKCWQQVVDTGYKIDKNGNCLAGCWESTLCTKYFWGNVLGNFDTKRAQGNVFFVFSDIDNSLVLWGTSRVEKVVGNKVYFRKFKPMSPERWIRGLSSEDIIDQTWGQGTYRFIDTQTESKLKKLITLKDESFDDPIETVITDKEGKLSLIKHLVKERSTKLVSVFKQSLSSYKCCICGFDFEETYGAIGRGFIEAHHTKPVSSLKEGERVSTKDFVAVCSNCHRMIHREYPALDWRKIKVIQKRRSLQITGGYLASLPVVAPTQILASLGLQIPASR